MSQISCGVGRSFLADLALGSAWASSGMMSLQRSIHSSQMKTDGPAISFRTSCWLLQQKEQYSSFSPTFSLITNLDQSISSSELHPARNPPPDRATWRKKEPTPDRDFPALYR